VPSRAVPGGSARVLHLDPLRWGRAPLPRGRLRAAGDAGGDRGDAAPGAAPRAAGPQRARALPRRDAAPEPGRRGDRRARRGDVATNPKRYQVSFLEAELDAGTVRKLEEARVDSERLAVIGREVYAWHPEGAARSRLWNLLAGKALGVTATARNWTTVTKLLE